MEFYLKDSLATENLGKILGNHVKNGDVFCFNGDLGAGKTLLTKGLAKSLGVNGEDINSPTFNIMNVYNGTDFEIRHFDLYRLRTAEELDDIGFYEYAGGDGVTIIEWADLFEDYLPEEYLLVNIQRERDGRKVFFKALGKRYEELLLEVEKCLL